MIKWDKKCANPEHHYVIMATTWLITRFCNSLSVDWKSSSNHHRGNPWNVLFIFYSLKNWYNDSNYLHYFLDPPLAMVASPVPTSAVPPALDWLPPRWPPRPRQRDLSSPRPPAAPTSWPPWRTTSSPRVASKKPLSQKETTGTSAQPGLSAIRSRIILR